MNATEIILTCYMVLAIIVILICVAKAHSRELESESIILTMLFVFLIGGLLMIIVLIINQPHVIQ